jgi:hypothetical protein
VLSARLYRIRRQTFNNIFVYKNYKRSDFSIWEGEPPGEPLFVKSGEEAVFAVYISKHNNVAHQEVRAPNFGSARPISGPRAQFRVRAPNFGSARPISGPRAQFRVRAHISQYRFRAQIPPSMRIPFRIASESETLVLIMRSRFHLGGTYAGLGLGMRASTLSRHALSLFLSRSASLGKLAARSRVSPGSFAKSYSSI